MKITYTIKRGNNNESEREILQIYSVFFLSLFLFFHMENSFKNNIVHLEMALPFKYSNFKTSSTSPKANVRRKNGMKEMQLLR